MSSRRHVIALAGPKGVGKTTLAQWLVQITHGVEIAFADKLKQHTGAKYGLSHDELHDATLKGTALERHGGRTPRQLLQAEGDALRAIDPDVFAKDVVNRICEMEDVMVVVVSDARFDNEARLLNTLDCDVHIWQIEREGSVDGGYSHEHATEQGLNSAYITQRLVVPSISCVRARDLMYSSVATYMLGNCGISQMSHSCSLGDVVETCYGRMFLPV